MGKTIEPKTFLMQQRTENQSVITLEPSDSLAITPLGVNIPLSVALNEQDFYFVLKKAVSEYNSNAALNGKLPEDFDDLHTRYFEYIEALKSFL